jgi:ferredoxin/flavodoxin
LNALILYFSGTGNTAHVAKKISVILKNMNYATELHSIEESYTIPPNHFDLLILGSPKYYEYPVIEFINYLNKNLPVSKKEVPTLFFCTQAGNMPTDTRKLHDLLSRRNYKLQSSRSFPIANNMGIFGFLSLTKPEIIASNLENLNKTLKPWITDFLNGKVMIERPKLSMRIFAYPSGVLFTKLFALFAVKFSPSADCTGCGLCAKKCPKQNIKLINHKPVFGHHCIFCLRCINRCPVNAILYSKKQCPQYDCACLKEK